MFATPLGVLFCVDEDDMLVSVLQVWDFRTRAD